MTFGAYEESLEDGRPIYLYRFSLNDKVWRFTSADETLVRGGFTWEAVPISDEGTSQTGNATTDALMITSTTSIVPAQLYMQYPPSSPVQVAIFETHEGDNEIIAIYMGEVTQMAIPQPGMARFTCETFSGTMQREGLRLGWQRGCTYALYDPVTCRVNKAEWGVAGVVASVVDNIVQLAALDGQPDARFRGGFVEWIDPVRGIERRGIEGKIGGAMLMFGSADGIEPGVTLTAYPGCPRTTSGCVSFNNLPNYGGVPALKGRSPFDGAPVFY